MLRRPFRCTEVEPGSYPDHAPRELQRIDAARETSGNPARRDGSIADIGRTV